MAQPPLSEKFEARLATLEAQAKRGGTTDPRIPLLATEFDVETAIFPPAVRVRNSANISINNNSTTTLTFDTDRRDLFNMHDTSANTDRLTAVVAGWYQVTLDAQFATNATGRRMCRLVTSEGGGTVFAQQEYDTNQNSAHRMNIGSPYYFATGAYAVAQVYHNIDGAGALNIEAGVAYTPEFSMVWLAP